MVTVTGSITLPGKTLSLEGNKILYILSLSRRHLRSVWSTYSRERNCEIVCFSPLSGLSSSLSLLNRLCLFFFGDRKMAWQSLVWFPRNGLKRLDHVCLIGLESSGILVLELLDRGFFFFFFFSFQVLIFLSLFLLYILYR